MTENIIETIRKGVQDFVAPEVRQLRADFGDLGAKFDGQRAEFDALRSEVRANQLALFYIFLRSQFMSIIQRWGDAALLSGAGSPI